MLLDNEEKGEKIRHCLIFQGYDGFGRSRATREGIYGGDTCLRFTHLGADFLESRVLIDYFVDVMIASKHKEIPILGERPSEAEELGEYEATAFSIWNRRDRNKTRDECRLG